ncbi:hypothetical protein ABVT39_023219 [Epinephelus coioides]
MAQNVKTNRERCQRIAQRVRALEELVLIIKQRGPGRISGVVENPLRELCTTLASAKRLMMEYSKRNSFKKFLRSSSHEDEFHMLNERLTNDHLILSGALQIDHGNMLHQVMETFSGRRQEEEYYSGQPRGVPIGTLPPNPMYGFTISMSHPSNIHPLPMSNPMPHGPPASIQPPSPVHYTMPPSPVSGTIPPGPFSTTTVPMPAPCYGVPHSYPHPSSQVCPRPPGPDESTMYHGPHAPHQTYGPTDFFTIN